MVRQTRAAGKPGWPDRVFSFFFLADSSISAPMHTTPPEQTESAREPLAARWRRLRAAYRLANLATHHVLGFAVKLALLLYFVFALLFLFLRYAILPNIDYYKGGIERAASAACGNRVEIARIYASWSGLRPNLFLGDVTLHDQAGRKVLDLPSVSATLAWWSLLAADVRFQSLEIIRPELDVRRAADGKLYVAGVGFDPNQGGGDGRGADWLLAQREIVIREGRITWNDEGRGAPPLLLDKLSLVLRNRWREHQFALRATPPASLAAPLDVRANFVHPVFSKRISDVAMWKGELFADLQNADLAAWKTYFDYPFALASGNGALRAWITLDHAKLAGFTADVGLANVSAQLGPELPPLELAQVSGRVAAREEFPLHVQDGLPTFGARGHEISLSDFSLQTRDGLSLAPTTLSEHYLAPAKGQPERVQFKARLLDLETLAALAERLPLSAAQRKLLADLAPRGRLQDFSAEWQGSFPNLSAYRIKGRVEGLGLNAQPAVLARPKTANAPAQAALPAVPGFQNLTGSVEANERGGGIQLAARDLVLQLPGYFSEPALPFEQLNVQARWSFEDKDQLRLQIDSMNFIQQGITGVLRGSHLMPLGAAPGQGLGKVDFSGSFNHFDVKTIGRYLPSATPPELRAWLTGALEDGMAEDVSLRLRGDLAQFPFKGDTAAERGRGEFRVAGRIVKGKLNYAPDLFAKDGKAPLWPQAEQIDGSFLFERARMEIRGDKARTNGGVELSSVKAVIADLGAPELLLDIDGKAAGPLQEQLRYVASSPVLEWISNFTDQTVASGNAKLALKLHLPLSHLLASKVQGTLQLAGNDITLFEDMPPVQRAQGKIEFNEKGVTLNNLSGSFLGGPVAVGGGTQRDNAIVVRIAGSASADGVRKTYPQLPGLAGRLVGSARYTGSVTLRERQLQVAVESNLAGLELNFPAPLKKAAAESLPLRFVLNGGPPNDAGLMRDEIKVALGPSMAARYQRQKQGREPWRIVRGGIGVNQPAPEPEAGMSLNVSMKTLNVDAWSALGAALLGPATGGASAAEAAPAPAIAQYLVPDFIAARAGELIMGERKLDNVLVGVTRQPDLWQANIDAKQVSGHVMWSEPRAGAGKLTARLATLIIPESAEAEVKDLLEGKNAAQTIPALDIMAERFELFNRPLGRLELLAYNPVAAAPALGREWRIARLALTNPDGELRSTGKWQLKDGQSNTSLNFTLDVLDAGKLLDRFGFADTLRKGKGKLSGDIAWRGLPYSLDIPSLSGQIQMNVESGQFLKQDPGAAKLLGVLSLQALPRLLKLDFHDVFSEGLAFDGISASASINRGVLKTENLKMHGVAATVLMDGSADIANETTDLHVVVIPEFNLGTGPLVYALAVNPVVGIGSFLAQLFLRAPVMKALTYRMRVTGPWKAPVITKLDNAKLDTAPVPAAATN
jgi:uncharacterized protein (TIGR02099 family)